MFFYLLETVKFTLSAFLYPEQSAQNRVLKLKEYILLKSNYYTNNYVQELD